jgi:hypothetical protein
MQLIVRSLACFAKYAGFSNVITSENSRDCLNVTQYLGAIVNAVQPNVLIGAYRFPADRALTELEIPARVVLTKSASSLEPILFGKWRD